MNDSLDVRPSFGALRVTLAIAGAVLLLVTYLCFFQIGFFSRFYGPGFPDPAHAHLVLVTGLFSLIFAIGALLALLQPLRYAGVVLLLALMHFGFFVLDVVLLAQGTTIAWYYLAIEMAYVLVVSVLLVRFFPMPLKLSNLVQTADALVDVVEKRQKDKTKAEPKPEPKATEEENQM